MKSNKDVTGPPLTVMRLVEVTASAHPPGIRPCSKSSTKPWGVTRFPTKLRQNLQFCIVNGLRGLWVLASTSPVSALIGS